MLSNDTLASHQEAAFISLCTLAAKGHAASWFYTRMNAKGRLGFPRCLMKPRNSATLHRSDAASAVGRRRCLLAAQTVHGEVGPWDLPS